MFSIARIVLEFDFTHTIESDTFKELTPAGFDDRLSGGLHEGAGVAKFYRILAAALRDEGSRDAALAENPTIRKLVLARSGDAFLDKNFFGRNVLRHQREAALQFGGVVRGQGFQVGQREKMVIHGRLENHRVRDVFLRKVREGIPRPSPRSGNAEIRGTTIGVAFVQREISDYGRGGGYVKYGAEDFAMGGEGFDVVIDAGEDYPVLKIVELSFFEQQFVE